MFERGLFIDGDWISNGEAFWQPSQVKQVSFIERFIEDESKADIELRPESKPFLHLDTWPCILFGGGPEWIVVQVENLKLIGVDLEVIDEYQFRMNSDTHLIYVYDPGFIGGVLPILANKEELKPAYPDIGK